MKFRRKMVVDEDATDFPVWMIEGMPMKKQTKKRKIRKSRDRMYRKTGNQKPLDFMKTTYGLKCDQCGTPEKLTVHHKIPVLDGGTNHPSNIAILCVRCHMRVHGRKYIRRLDNGQKKEIDEGDSEGTEEAAKE